ncbi:MAG: hypothetical protein PHW45_04050 [Candidatus ainarchaeum sp.]|nr:hypothetical protein [Candidatus ainarchaeum sp.]MDD4221136.1 hypothetical protein [Candidatus ainarchaeum sp.]MDD4662626.1 hypothetical protein [Candidatus ainarchaeum sp.]
MNLQNNNFQKRSLSPIISVILLVLVAAILTGAILSWSKNTVKEKLDVSKENLKQASDIDCINSNFYVESCKIDFFTKEISLLVINNSLLNYGNLVLTVNGQSFDGSDIKLYGNFETSVLAGESVNLLTSSNFSFKDESSFDSLDPYNIKNISLVSSTCPNSPIVFSNCDIIIDE